MWGKHREERATAEELEFVEECEAFLTGRYPGHLAVTGTPVPPWAWLNPIAHGGLVELRSLAGWEADAHPVRYGTGVWKQAVSYLAQEVLCQAGEDEPTLCDMQRTSLVPLELELARVAAQVDPGQLVWLVLDALAKRQTHRSR